MIKKYGVWIALMLTLAATAWVSTFEDDESVSKEADVVVPISHGTRTASNLSLAAQEKAEGQMSSSVLSVQRQMIAEEPLNIFIPYIAVASMPDKSTTESATPTVANPFVYAGKLVEDGNVVVFLIDGDKSHAVKSGDVIEEMWQVKSITPPVMKLKNIPSKIEMQLQIGALG